MNLILLRYPCLHLCPLLGTIGPRMNSLAAYSSERTIAVKNRWHFSLGLRAFLMTMPVRSWEGPSQHWLSVMIAGIGYADSQRRATCCKPLKPPRHEGLLRTISTLR